MAFQPVAPASRRHSPCAGPAFSLFLAACLFGARATAASTSASAPAPAPAPLPASGNAAAWRHGLVVVASPSAADAAWPLARQVYGEASLRDADLTDADARVLCGDPASSSAPQAQRDLAEMVAALHGDDAPSRTLLGEIARRVAVRSLLVVHVDGGRTTAQVFLAESQSFDAATYAPDAGAVIQWTAAVRSLVRAYGESTSTQTASASAPTLATHEAPPAHRTSSHAFYESGWFWAALAGAALIGGGIYLATRDTGAGAIHLEVQVPHE